MKLNFFKITAVTSSVVYLNVCTNYLDRLTPMTGSHAIVYSTLADYK